MSDAASVQGSIDARSRQSSIRQQQQQQVHPNGGTDEWTWLDYVKRAYILLLGLAAVVFSILVIFSCEFFTYRTLDGQPWEGLMPPFDTLSSASVGLFSFSATVSEEGIDLTFLDGQCVEYEDPWSTGQSDYWMVAQWCAIAAPVAGFLAWIQLILEMMACRLRCSFLMITILFLVGSALQGCSFMIFADREFCFNAASQNQCRLDSGAWFSMASTVSYLILAILCTSIDPFIGHSTKLFCFVCTGSCCCRRNARRSSRGDIESVGEDKINNSTSDDSTVEGKNWRDVVDDEDVDDDVDVSIVDSGFSGLDQTPTGESKDGDGMTQTSTELALNSASLDSDPLPVLTQSESDVVLNKNDAYPLPVVERTEEQAEETAKEVVPIEHKFPRKPDFLDMCCAGDPLKVEQHLEGRS